MDRFKEVISVLTLEILFLGLAISLVWSPSIIVVFGLKTLSKRKPNPEWNTSVARYILQGAIFKGALTTVLLPSLFSLDGKTAWMLIEVYPLAVGLILFPFLWLLEPLLFVIKKGPILNAIYAICQLAFVWIVSCFLYFASQQ